MTTGPCMELDFQLRLFSCSRRGFCSDRVHISPIYILQLAHPGAGIPGVLCSAKVVESLVDEDEKQAIATARVDAL